MLPLEATCANLIVVYMRARALSKFALFATNEIFRLLPGNRRLACRKEEVKFGCLRLLEMEPQLWGLVFVVESVSTAGLRSETSGI